jgi:hypothetical protein
LAVAESFVAGNAGLGSVRREFGSKTGPIAGVRVQGGTFGGRQPVKFFDFRRIIDETVVNRKSLTSRTTGRLEGQSVVFMRGDGIGLELELDFRTLDRTAYFRTRRIREALKSSLSLRPLERRELNAGLNKADLLPGSH